MDNTRKRRAATNEHLAATKEPPAATKEHLAATKERRAAANEQYRDALVAIYEWQFAESAPQRAQRLLDFLMKVGWYYTGPNYEVCRVQYEDIVWWLATQVE